MNTSGLKPLCGSKNNFSIFLLITFMLSFRSLCTLQACLLIACVAIPGLFLLTASFLWLAAASHPHVSAVPYNIRKLVGFCFGVLFVCLSCWTPEFWYLKIQISFTQQCLYWTCSFWGLFLNLVGEISKVTLTLELYITHLLKLPLNFLDSWSHYTAWLKPKHLLEYCEPLSFADSPHRQLGTQ